MRNVSDKKNLQRMFCFKKIYFPKFVPFMWLCGKIHWRQKGSGDNITRRRKGTPCMLVNKGYRQTLRICKTYCFSAPTIVTRTRLHGTLQVLCFVYTNVLNSAVDTQFLTSTYPSATYSSNVHQRLWNVALRKVNVVLVLQITQPQLKCVTVRCQVNNCTYLTL